MTLYLTHQEAEAILDMCKGALTKAQFPFRDTIQKQIEARLGINQPTSKNGWAPMGRIKPSWPDGVTKSPKKQNPYFHKPRDKKIVEPKPTKPPLSAEDILASI